ncbi:MAG: dihydroneopterin aldolase [Pseudomonadota bacterium]
MAHFAHMLSVNRLTLAAHIGFYNGERAKPQPIEICFRLYFPEAPACALNDEADFFDYGMLCKLLQDYVEAREFKLVEFMASDVFRHLRSVIDARGGEHIKLWLRLNKIAAPVPGLTGGASFTHCDVPAGATVAPLD